MSLFCKCKALEKRILNLEQGYDPQKMGQRVVDDLMWRLSDFSRNKGSFPIEMVERLVEQIKSLQLK